MGGSWSKWYLMLGAAESDQLAMMAVLMASSLLAIGYLMPVVARAFFRPPPAGHGHGDNPGDGIREAPLLCVLPPVLTAIGCLVLFVLADDIYRLLMGVVAP
jgi:multicomponent Na+:H+ antiporter subunit D